MVAALLHLDDGPGAAVEAFDQMRRCLAHRENSPADTPAEIAVAFGAHLFGIAEHGVDFGHCREARGIDLRRATRDDERAPRMFAAQLADGLPRLTLGLGRNGAGIDDDRVVEPGRLGMPADRFGFEGVEAATERDDVERQNSTASKD